MARALWAFRKSKATKLLAKIESHKLTVQLIATTMLLAVEERKYHADRAKGSTQGSNSENYCEQLRKEAETLVQATEEARRDLLMRAEVSLQEDQGRQVDFDTETPKTGAANETTEEHASLESTVPETSSCKNGTIQARTQRDGYTDWFFRRASYLVLAHPRPRLLSSSTRLPRGACWMAFFTRGPP